jgi:hypothetical protein
LAPSLGNSWRTTNDIQDNWVSMISNIHNVNLLYISRIRLPFLFPRTISLQQLQDQVVGMIQIVSVYYVVFEFVPSYDIHVVLETGNGGMTDAEYVTHFSLWAISKAPLLIGCDVTKMSAATLSTLTNPEVIAVNQDPLGVQGKLVAFAPAHSPNASTGVMVANLSLPGVDLRRFQWTYNAQDGSIRSVYNGRCVSIDRCSKDESADIVLDDCHIGDPQAQCQGKNQQWIISATNQTFASQLNGKW